MEQLLKPPSNLEIPNPKLIDTSLLSPEEASLYEQLRSFAPASSMDARVDSIFSRLEPTVDAFADNVLKIAQYRDAGDNVATRVLSIAAEKLSERQKESRRRAQPQDKERSPRRDLGNVLRGLSRADR